MAQKLPELLSELAEKAHQLENKFASAKEGTEEQLQQWKDDVKQTAFAQHLHLITFLT